MKRPVVVHHIVPWSDSKDHSEQNLVVLCLEHHDAAHTKKALSLSLPPSQIRGHKREWLEAVKTADANTILGLARIDGAHWDYINHNRMFELARALGVQPSKHRFFQELQGFGLVHETGVLLPFTRVVIRYLRPAQPDRNDSLRGRLSDDLPLRGSRADAAHLA